MGDGVLAYFGWPIASEDDAERAVRAGLTIVKAIMTLNRRLVGKTGTELAVRVGIHCGWVVVDELGGNKAEIFGDAPNIASRVQARCAPNFVLMTGAVHDLVAGRFIVEDFGVHPLAGIDRPVQLYRAVAPSGARRSWRRVGARGPTPFVNRKHEFDLLWQSWLSARDGAGQYVFVTGEPGIGKSRLVEQFRSSIRDAHIWMECAGERFFENTPFYAVIKLLEQALGLEKEDSAEGQILQLKRGLRLSGLDLAETMPLIAEILKLPPSPEYPVPQVGPEQARSRLMAGLAGWVLNLARLQPLIILVEDLHWLDPSSVELTGMLIEQAVNVPLMLVATARQEYRLPWELRSTDRSIVVGRLGNDEISEMIAGSSNVDGLTEDIVASVVKRSDGVPIFTEELLSFILEGAGNSTAQDIPTTLLDSLTARLDRLGPARRVAQVAAVLGREFDYSLLRAVVPGSDHDVQSALAALTRADLIFTQGSPPKASYQFKHALIRDAAYEGLLRSERRELHQQVARAISEQFPALAEAQPVLLARHWSEAGEAERAADAWMRAGEAALARCAYKEAEEACRQASGSLGLLPPSEARDRRELAISTALARVLQVTRGYSSPESMQIGARARELAERFGELGQLIHQGQQTWAAIFITGDYDAATALAERILEMTVAEGRNFNQDFFAHYAQVLARFYTADLAGVEQHFAKLSLLLDPARPMASAADIIAIGSASNAAWYQGRFSVARERIARALVLARRSEDPYGMAMALHFKGHLHWCLRAPRRAEVVAKRLLSLSEQHGFGYVSDLARIRLGSAMSELGHRTEGLELIAQGMVGFAKAGANVAITLFLTMLAEAQARAGDFESALRTVEKALNTNPRELIWRAYALACRGEIRLGLGQADMAEADFRSAIKTARSQGNKAWELRAATSLARLLMRRGHHRAALENLAPVYASFSEGFQTPDLREARSLLDEMAHLPAD